MRKSNISYTDFAETSTMKYKRNDREPGTWWKIVIARQTDERQSWHNDFVTRKHEKKSL